MSEHKVYLIGGKDDEVATVTAEPRDGMCHIAFSYRDRTIEESASDYFKAFCQVRIRLESERLLPFCYGASLNVYPSGMCRDMGEGLQAYRLSPDRKPTRADLVHIFEEGADVAPAYVALQKEYFDDWLKKSAKILPPTSQKPKKPWWKLW
jgi:hypothetical protein